MPKNNNEQREFWIVYDKPVREKIILNYEPMDACDNNFIHVREITPESESELEELRRDRARLEWMIENTGWYRYTDHDEEHTYIQIKMLPKSDLSCRPMIISAIDAAAGFDWSKG